MLDWWVLGGAAELDAFGAMVEGFSALTDEMRRDILVRGGSCMGHTYYGLQLRRMNATLRFVGNKPRRLHARKDVAALALPRL